MPDLRCTLLGDGSSDQVLLGIVSWCLQDNAPAVTPQMAFADSSQLPAVAGGLARRIEAALNLFPCELLCVHRDAETAAIEQRRSEISRAVDRAVELGTACPRYVCVVPVRMTEAWLMFNEDAVRRASGNVRGTAPLALPPAAELESVPDPKQVLRELLVAASEAHGRRLKQLRASLPARIHRVADYITDFSPLRQLAAFRAFEQELRDVLGDLVGA